MRQRMKKCMAAVMTVLWLGALVWNMDVTGNAGFGDYNDYDYGDSWDSDWDSGDSWDSSWDDDDDWGYSYGYSGGGSSGGGSSNAMDQLIALVVIIAILAISFSKYKNNNSATSRPGTGAPTPRTSGQSQRQQCKPLPNRTDEITKIMQEKDQNFTPNDFLTYVKRVYVDIQDAWSKRDLEPVRPVLHPNLYQQTQKQIQKKIEDGIVNYLERIAVNTAYLSGYRRDDDYEYMIVYLSAQMIDYQVKESTGQILYGDKTTRWSLQYKMTFMRAADMVTPDASEEENENMKCPNCGAPIEGTAFGKCEYCGSVVSTGKYGWVLSDFGVIRQDTVDEGIKINK